MEDVCQLKTLSDILSIIQIYKEMSIHCLKTQTHDMFFDILNLTKEKFQQETEKLVFHKDKTEIMLGPKINILEF